MGWGVGGGPTSRFGCGDRGCLGAREQGTRKLYSPILHYVSAQVPEEQSLGASSDQHEYGDKNRHEKMTEEQPEEQDEQDEQSEEQDEQHDEQLDSSQDGDHKSRTHTLYKAPTCMNYDVGVWGCMLRHPETHRNTQDANTHPPVLLQRHGLVGVRFPYVAKRCGLQRSKRAPQSPDRI